MKRTTIYDFTVENLQKFMMLMSLANRVACYIAFSEKDWQLFLDEPEGIDYVYMSLEDIQDHLNNFI